jgi:UPF0176 protein
MYTVLLYYRYVNVPDPEGERKWMLELGNRLGLKGRILIGQEGINGTVSGTAESTNAYIEAMNLHPLFAHLEYKIDSSDTLPFPRLRVKVREEIVTLGVDVDPTQTAPKLSPVEFDAMMQDPSVVLFDARNHYESAIGKFRGAITSDVDLFKDLPAALDKFQDLKDKTVVTYCTGGIRCEKASALMKQQGFKNIYQLDGGIIKYGQTFPNGAFEGECFVFDGRMKVAFKDNPEIMGRCHICRAPTNSYINCAYKPCNQLVLACDVHAGQEQTCSAVCAQQLATV